MVIFAHLFGGVGPVLYGEGTDLFVEWEECEIELAGGGELSSEHPDNQSVTLDVNPEVTRERIVIKRLGAEKISTEKYIATRNIPGADTGFCQGAGGSASEAEKSQRSDTYSRQGESMPFVTWAKGRFKDILVFSMRQARYAR